MPDRYISLGDIIQPPYPPLPYLTPYQLLIVDKCENIWN